MARTQRDTTRLRRITTTLRRLSLEASIILEEDDARETRKRPSLRRRPAKKARR